MPIIRQIPQDPTDLVIQGELLRQSVLDPNNIPDFNIGLLMGGPSLSALGTIVGDEDAFTPMNSFCEIGTISVRRQKNGNLQLRANAGISTPCGAWIVRDWPQVTLMPFQGAWTQFFVTGVSRDSAGAALGACTVKVFLTGNDTKQFETVSDASGNWSIDVGANPGPFYFVEYKVGPPDLAGTSINTNVPTATS